MNKGVKVGIALEGGGAKGAYQTGVLRALRELDINYECVVGTSIGALNAASYIVGDYERSSNLWRNMNFSIEDKSKSNSNNYSNIFDKLKNNIDEFEKYYMNSDGADPEPVIQFFKEIIDEEAIRLSNIEFGLTTYCLTDRKSLRLFKEDIPNGMLHEFIFASCCLPVFKARPINGKYYLDGSLFSKLPVEMASYKGCDVIIAVRLHPDKYDFENYSNIKIIDIAPDKFLSSTLEASQDRIVWMINKGYEDAVKILKNSVHPII